MYLKTFRGKTPRAAGRAYVAENATLIGDVTLGEGCSIWPGAVLRGDCAPISVGTCSNLQDNAVVHTDARQPTLIGESCLIGHAAIIHSCVLEPGVLVGMGAIVMTGAHIGAGSVIGAGAVVTENKVIPPGSVVMGVPGRVVNSLSDSDRDRTPYECAEYRCLAEELLVPVEPGELTG